MPETSEEAPTPPAKRKGGRPRGRFDPTIPWQDIEKAYVYGDPVEPNEKGEITEPRHWPSMREVATRFGVAHQLVGRKSKQLNWGERRRKFKETLTLELDRAVAKDLALSTADGLAIVDRWVREFARKLDSGDVRADSFVDLDKALRLREFLLGQPDSRSEKRHVLSLEDLTSRHETHRARTAELDEGESGMLPPADIDTIGEVVEEVAPAVAATVKTRQLEGDDPNESPGDQPGE